jgi:hypothetical protein
VNQLDEGLKWLDAQVKQNGSGYVLVQSEFEEVSGVGQNITAEMIEAAVSKLFDQNVSEINELGHGFNFAVFLNKMKDIYKWADGGLVRTLIDKKKLELLGEAPAAGEIKKKKFSKAETKPKESENQEEEEQIFDIT